MCVVLPVYMYVCVLYACLVFTEPRRGIGSLGIGISVSWEPPCRCWEINLGLLETQLVFHRCCPIFFKCVCMYVCACVCRYICMYMLVYVCVLCMCICVWKRPTLECLPQWSTLSFWDSFLLNLKLPDSAWPSDQSHFCLTSTGVVGILTKPGLNSSPQVVV